MLSIQVSSEAASRGFHRAPTRESIGNDVNLLAGKFFSQCRQAIKLALGVAVFEDDVFTIDVTEFAELPLKCLEL